MTRFCTAIYLLYVPRTKNLVTSKLSKIKRIARHFASALLIGRELTKELRLLGETPLRSETQNKTRDILLLENLLYKSLNKNPYLERVSVKALSSHTETRTL